MNAPISPNAVASPAWPAEPALKVGGITSFTATDYPGKLAAVVFVQGCPWRCSYCHNPHLQTRAGPDALPWDRVMARLRRRIGLLDAVVFSGGEPTIDPGLAGAMTAVRALGLGVGLHTAGAYPRRLAEVLPLVDWVGMDVKAGFDAYDTITRISDSARHAQASALQVLASGVAHEFRTTVHPDLHTDQDILALAQTLNTMGVRNYALQVFRATGCVDEGLSGIATSAYPDVALLEQVSTLFETFTVRQA